MEQSAHLPISVAIPTYGREQVLLRTLQQIIGQRPGVSEVLVIDQTPQHEPDTQQELQELDSRGVIRWIRLGVPSQPGALNCALQSALHPVVLFIDDDIEVDNSFAEAHLRQFSDESVWAVAGQVLQPGQAPEPGWKRREKRGPFADIDFPFHSDRPAVIGNGMSGNFSVRRDRALQIGGFDENFLPPVSYRFDADFCKRIVAAGGRIVFDPEARVNHLRAPSGGTRSVGSHLTSASPMHGVGDYYFALRRGIGIETLWYIARRPFREVRTRFHLWHPWWIPVKLIGEWRALLLALRLWRRGPKLMEHTSA